MIIIQQNHLIIHEILKHSRYFADIGKSVHERGISFCNLHIIVCLKFQPDVCRDTKSRFKEKCKFSIDGS